MRYYNIAITNSSGQPVLPQSLGGLPISSLLPNGQYNPGALQVELDIPVTAYHQPSGQGFVRIWGIGLQQIGAAFDLNGCAISVSGGMSKGLPLATAAAPEAGLLAQGKIFQAFGNWIGTEQTIDLIFIADTGTVEDQRNIVLNWQAGTPLATALQQTLSAAFPGMPINIAISNNLILPYAESSYHFSLQELAYLVNRMSKVIDPSDDYPGVQIAINGGTIDVWDGTQPPTAPVKAIAFQSMIGQPTWIAPLTIQVKLMMRGDLDLFQTVSLPPSLVTTQASALTRFQDQTSFSGNFQIQAIRHVGNSRQPDAASWVTVVNMIQAPASSASTATEGT